MAYSRRLVTIMFTDIVGYTKLMQESESAAVEIRTRHRAVIEAFHKKRNGKVIQYYGDGSLSIFDSAFECVLCAIEIQREFRKEPVIPLRIGVHLGDVLVTESDIIGNSVNITSRIESLGQSGTILISNQIREEISNHDISLELLGSFQFKNDRRKREVYAVIEKGIVRPDIHQISGKLAKDETHTLASQGVAETDPPISSEEDFDNLVNEVIKEFLDDSDFSVTMLCKKVGYSRPQLYRKLQALYGLSPSDYIREVRLREAARLLELKAGNVSEIAYKTGFNNLSYFSKVFQDRFGMVPSAYIKKKAIPSVRGTLNSFIGRESEIESIIDLLEHSRILTLTGPGGTGKTRLALQVIDKVGANYPDGFHIVQLAPVSDSSGVLPKIAQILKIKQNTLKDPLEIITEFIGSQNMLLLLDNFEHVLDAVEDVREILLHCERLTILVTSRVALAISGEREFPVTQLGIPEERNSYEIEELMEVSAVKLLVERAQAVKPNFTITEENKESIIAICRRLDGLPLAIELAAARIKVFSPQALWKRISSSLDILSTNASMHPDRHKTIRTAIGWSYNLLQPEEQTLFRRLSIFGGGSTLDSAEDVCFEGYRDNLAFIDHMSSLVDKSLIYQVEQDDGEPRFFMLETLRAFGLEKLEASNEKDTIFARYMNYFRQFLSDKPPQFTKGNVKEVLNEVELELDNVRSILSHADRNMQVEVGLEICSYIWRYWVIRSMMREGVQWLDRFLQKAPDDLETESRCSAMNAYGIMMSLTQNWHDSTKALEVSYKIASKKSYDRLAGEALNHLGWAYSLVPIVDQGEDRSRKALAIYQNLGNKRGIAVSLNNLAWLSFWKGDYESSIEHCRKSKDLRLEVGDIRGYAFAITNEVMCNIHFGRMEGALSQINESLEILMDLADNQLIAWCLTMKGVYQYFNDQCDKALDNLQQARNIWGRIGTHLGYYWTDLITCEIRMNRNMLEGIGKMLEELTSRTEAYAGVHRPSVDMTNARFLYKCGKLEEALEISANSLEVILKKGLNIYLPQALELMSYLLQQSDQHSLAAKCFNTSCYYRIHLEMPLPKVFQSFLKEIKSHIAMKGPTGISERNTETNINLLIAEIRNSDVVRSNAQP